MKLTSLLMCPLLAAFRFQRQQPQQQQQRIRKGTRCSNILLLLWLRSNKKSNIFIDAWVKDYEMSDSNIADNFMNYPTGGMEFFDDYLI